MLYYFIRSIYNANKKKIVHFPYTSHIKDILEMLTTFFHHDMDN